MPVGRSSKLGQHLGRSLRPHSPLFRRLSTGSGEAFLSAEAGEAATQPPWGLRRVSSSGGSADSLCPESAASTVPRRKISMEFSCSKAAAALVQSPCRGLAYRTQRRKLYHQDSPPTDPAHVSAHSDGLADFSDSLRKLSCSGGIPFRLGDEEEDEDTAEEDGPDDIDDVCEANRTLGQPDLPQPQAQSLPATSSLPSLLGRGGFGSVFMAKYNQERAAVKELFAGPAGQRSSLLHELNVFRLQHPHIVRLLSFSVPQGAETVQVVYEYVGSRNLREWLDDETEPFPPQTAGLAAAEQVTSALLYCHSRLLLHLDVKAANVLVRDPPSPRRMSLSQPLAPSASPALPKAPVDVKLSDFGSSRRLDSSWPLESGLGTPTHAAPELLRGQRPSTPADVFSLGVLLWEIATRLPVHPGLHPHALVFQVGALGLRPALQPFLPRSDRGDQAPRSPASEARTRLLRCAEAAWAQDAADRPPLTDLLRQLNRPTSHQRSKPSLVSPKH